MAGLPEPALSKSILISAIRQRTYFAQREAKGRMDKQGQSFPMLNPVGAFFGAWGCGLPLPPLEVSVLLGFDLVPK